MIAATVMPTEKTKLAMHKRFHALDETGIARVGESVASGEIIINKHAPVMTADAPTSNNDGRT
jgi:DNA-directed RNA polymerase beta subunit